MSQEGGQRSDAQHDEHNLKNPRSKPVDRSLRPNNHAPSKLDSKPKHVPNVPHLAHHLHEIEVHERKLYANYDKHKSPYAVDIIQLPPDYDSSTNDKITVTDRENKLLTKKMGERKFPERKDPKRVAEPTQTFIPWSSLHPPESPPLKMGSIPLKLWPNFDQVNGKMFKANYTQTKIGKGPVRFADEITNEFSSTTTLQNETGKAKVSASTSAEEGLNFVKDQEKVSSFARLSQTFDSDSVHEEHLGLTKLAARVETGILTVSEACGILIHTIFKDSFASPSTIDEILQSQQFQDFRNSPNEFQALEHLAYLLSTTNRTLLDYLNVASEMGIHSLDSIGKEEAADFPWRILQTSDTLSSTGTHPTISNDHVWNILHRDPESKENFQLSLLYHPETGEICQTITCDDDIFSTTYATSILEEPHGRSFQKIRSISSSKREKQGLPIRCQPGRLLDTVSRSSSYICTKQTVAKSWINKCSKRLDKALKKFSKLPSQGKFSSKLNTRIQKLNVFAGILYQVSSELTLAFKKIQLATSRLQIIKDVLQSDKSKVSLDEPLTKSVSMVDAIKYLRCGMDDIDSTFHLGMSSLASSSSGVQLKKKQGDVIESFMEGIVVLRRSREVEYGSLLMSILCCNEMILYFKDDMTKTDQQTRANVVILLDRIETGTSDLIASLREVQNGSNTLTVRTMASLREMQKKKADEDRDKGSSRLRFWELCSKSQDDDCVQ